MANQYTISPNPLTYDVLERAADGELQLSLSEESVALIQKCRIQLVETEAVQIRAFVSLPTDRNAGGGYRLTSEVVSDESMKEELLHDIRLTISRWTRKLHLLDQDIADLLIEVETRIKQQPEDRAAA